MENANAATLAIDESTGFFKLRELFGWSDCLARAEAWRCALSGDADRFDAACAACKELDFRHAPSGLSLLALVMSLEAGGDDLNTPLLRVILARGANPNWPLDTQGRLALHLCAFEERVDAALLLVDRGADPYVRPSGSVSLDDLAKGGHRVARRIMQLVGEP
jgi:hypothetical protein